MATVAGTVSKEHLMRLLSGQKEQLEREKKARAQAEGAASAAQNRLAFLEAELEAAKHAAQPCDECQLLQERMQELEAARDAMEEELAALETAGDGPAASADARALAAEARLGECEEEKSRLATRAAELAQALQQAQTELPAGGPGGAEALEEAQISLAAAEAELSALEASKAELELELRKRETEANQLREELEATRAQEAELRATSEAAAADQSAMKDVIGELEAARVEIEAMQEQLIQERETWSAEKATQNDKLESAGAELAAAERDLRAERQALVTAQEKLAETEAELLAERQALATAREALAEAEAKLVAERQALATAREELAEAEAEWEAKLETTAVAQQAAAAEAEALKAQVEKLAVQRDTAKAERERGAQMLETLELEQASNAASWAKEREQLVEALAQVKQQRSELSDQVDSLTASRDEELGQLERASAELAEVRTRLNALEHGDCPWSTPQESPPPPVDLSDPVIQNIFHCWQTPAARRAFVDDWCREMAQPGKMPKEHKLEIGHLNREVLEGFTQLIAPVLRRERPDLRIDLQVRAEACWSLRMSAQPALAAARVP